MMSIVNFIVYSFNSFMRLFSSTKESLCNFITLSSVTG